MLLTSSNVTLKHFVGALSSQPSPRLLYLLHQHCRGQLVLQAVLLVLSTCPVFIPKGRLFESEGNIVSGIPMCKARCWTLLSRSGMMQQPFPS